MRHILTNIPCIVFLIGGSYLLMHEHPVAGGWLIAASILSAQFPTSSTEA